MYFPIFTIINSPANKQLIPPSPIEIQTIGLGISRSAIKQIIPRPKAIPRDINNEV